MSFSGIFSTLMLLGALQGFIMSGLLFFSKKRPARDRLLAILILLIALACLNLHIFESSWINELPLLQFLLNFVPLVVVMPLGPLLYFYVKSSLDPAFRVNTTHRPHFYSTIIDIVPQLIAVTYVGGVMGGILKNHPQPWGIAIDTYNVYADIPRWFSMTIYVYLSYRYISSAQVNNEKHLRWIRQFLKVFLVFQLIWFVYLVPYVIPKYTDKLLDMVDWYPVYIPLVILIYYLGIKGYMMTAEEETTAKKSATPPAPIPDTVIGEAVPLLMKAMEQDQLYLNPELNLALVAQHTGLPTKTISAVLNQHLQKSFNEFVNEYRVAAFKQKIAESRQEQYTIMSLALESGFNSLPTFQRAFRNNTGMSPREYMNNQNKMA
ncbi:helix-turn-helix domain-containing protein [Chitinophaga pinensis]|uniref:Transcriptional regulator, AraC family n=1 Tax=Chitinophaga pinensis (strain ATCC 43595 / DSM 2588 / LMG 13176 / NBRC 15968 / NCIMB 11800 / UQM 2034) TaxID=485918 RepID=A0A979FZV5_CHIPD|nr:helix-turn-helix domain-containing protein [Chitinophaga pinensis]ACU58136.1 transcriptional regulator, AraC family [Chitinophaga pinensis DSM 2588]